MIVAARGDAFESVREALESIEATQLDGSPFEEDIFDGEHVLTATSSFGRLDILPEGESPLPLAELLERANAVIHDGVRVMACSVEDLAHLKRIADRPQDRADLAALEDLHGPLE